MKILISNVQLESCFTLPWGYSGARKPSFF